MMRSFQIVRISNPQFCETLYILSLLQVSNPLVFWVKFMEVSVRHRILPLFLVIMTSYVIVELLNLHILLKNDISYHPCKFQCSIMSGYNFTEGVDNIPSSPPPPPSPVLYREKKAQFF